MYKKSVKIDKKSTDQTKKSDKKSNLEFDVS